MQSFRKTVQKKQMQKLLKWVKTLLDMRELQTIPRLAQAALMPLIEEMSVFEVTFPQKGWIGEGGKK